MEAFSAVHHLGSLPKYSVSPLVLQYFLHCSHCTGHTLLLFVFCLWIWSKNDCTFIHSPKVLLFLSSRRLSFYLNNISNYHVSTVMFVGALVQWCNQCLGWERIVNCKMNTNSRGSKLEEDFSSLHVSCLPGEECRIKQLYLCFG